MCGYYDKVTCSACIPSAKPGGEPSAEFAAEYRRKMGCDGPTDYPQDEIQCFACSGRRDDCQRCGGEGFLPVYRCPNKVGREFDPLVELLARAHGGQWPVAGGSLEQTRDFMLAYDVFATEAEVIADVIEERNREK